MSNSLVKVFVLSKKEHDILTVDEMIKQKIQRQVDLMQKIQAQSQSKGKKTETEESKEELNPTFKQIEVD